MQLSGVFLIQENLFFNRHYISFLSILKRNQMQRRITEMNDYQEKKLVTYRGNGERN